MSEKIGEILLKHFIPVPQAVIDKLAKLVNEENAKLAVSSMMHISDNAKKAERKRIKAVVKAARPGFYDTPQGHGEEALWDDFETAILEAIDG